MKNWTAARMRNLYCCTVQNIKGQLNLIGLNMLNTSSVGGLHCDSQKGRRAAAPHQEQGLCRATWHTNASVINNNMTVLYNLFKLVTYFFVIKISWEIIWNCRRPIFYMNSNSRIYWNKAFSSGLEMYSPCKNIFIV